MIIHSGQEINNVTFTRFSDLNWPETQHPFGPFSLQKGPDIRCAHLSTAIKFLSLDDVIVLECPYAVCPFHSPALITLNLCDESVSPNKFVFSLPITLSWSPSLPRVSQSKIATPDEYKCFHLLRPTPPLQQLQGKFNKAFISRLNTRRSIKHGNHFFSNPKVYLTTGLE